MVLQDRIYQDIDIKNDFIIELIGSSPMQRIKEISFDGSAHFIQPGREISRFEHCVGTWYLSYQLNRPIEEQAACLLHDVPHTAFSHVVDFVMEDADQNYHEKFFKKIIYNSEIPDICKKYKIDLSKIIKTENFILLDNHTPEISFDRWDYFMRSGYAFGILPLEVIKLILSSVKLKGEQLYFEDLRVASLFSIMTIQICRFIYIDPTAHGATFLLANAIKLALQKGIINMNDLFNDDRFVWDKLENSNSKEIENYLRRLAPGKEFHYSSKEDAEFYGPNKARYIDPLVKINKNFLRVSDIIPGMKDYIEEFRNKAKFIGVQQA